MARRSTDGFRRAYLEDLAETLKRRGFDAEVGTSPTGVPSLRVANHEVPVLAETVLCAQGPNGALGLFWEWGQRITEAHAIGTAAVVIGQVLRSRDE